MRVPQRGRAILRRLSPQDSVRAFRPGDILLTASDGGLARLLGWATGGNLNHAALIVDPLGTVVEANPTLLSDARAFRLTTVSDYLQSGKPCWIGYVELREGTRQEVVAYAEHLLRAGGTHTLAGRLWLALHALVAVAPRARTARHAGLRALQPFFDRHALVVREEHCLSSGEFVARALERGGFIWDRDPAHITPDELFQRYHLSESAATITPMPLARARKVRRRASPPSAVATQEGGAPITPFIRRDTEGATALAEAPEANFSPQTGLRALIQVGVFMAAGLAVIGVLEEMMRLTGTEA